MTWNTCFAFAISRTSSFKHPPLIACGRRACSSRTGQTGAEAARKQRAQATISCVRVHHDTGEEFNGLYLGRVVADSRDAALLVTGWPDNPQADGHLHGA